MHFPHSIAATAALFFLLLVPAGQLLAAQPVGTVVLATGNIWAQDMHKPDEAKTKRTLRRKDPIFVGDTLATQNGALTLRMRDNAIISLKPHSKLTIHAYQAAADGQEAAIQLELHQGNLRSKTGTIGENAHHRYRLDTPFAALGIRGTDYTANLEQNELGVYVHSGAIQLAPFNPELNCIPFTLGSCNTPMAATLRASDNNWLRLQPGDSIERISGTPSFVNRESTTSNISPGLYDAFGTPLTPSATYEQELEFDNTADNLPSPDDDTSQEWVAGDLDGLQEQLMLDGSGDTDGDGISDREEFGSNTNPWSADTDNDGLQDDVDSTPNQANTHLFKTDFNPNSLTEEEIQTAFRSTHMRVDAYTPLGNSKLFNLQMSLRNNLSLSSWIDLDSQRMWGQTGSLKTILAARYWPEGQFWNALPESLHRVGATDSKWIEYVRKNEVDLWHLPLGHHSLYFTPGEKPLSQGAHDFGLRWAQPLGNPAGHARSAQISDFKADANGRFQFYFSTGNQNFIFRGAVGDAGILFAENDFLTMRGHWVGDSLVILISEDSSDQQWMFGLQQGNASDSGILSQWENRSTNGVDWGHWADFAQLDAEKLALLSRGNQQLAVNSHFSLETPGTHSLPTGGSTEFSLASATAIHSTESGMVPAQVLNPTLRVDFDQQRFVTRFDVISPNMKQSTSVLGAGSFDDKGLMHSDESLSNANLEGALDNRGNSAALLFEKTLSDDGYVSGITHWE